MNNIVLTTKQQEGLKIALERYKNKERYTCIAGYAGSGKSTLVNFIVSALDLDPNDIAYVAYTGKAASVLREKGCPNAVTAHKLLYKAIPTKDGRYIFMPKPMLDEPYRLLVVDEVSMLPKDMWNLLLSYRVHVLALGDPYQLPPIYKDADNHVLDHPHVFLDEIMRQAKDSEIIQLSMKIRNKEPLTYFKGKEVQIISREDFVNGMYLWADQILVATNKLRNSINTHIRTNILGRGPKPEEGDKVICLQNSWDCLDVTEQQALINGTIGTLGEYKVHNYMYYPCTEKKVKTLRTKSLIVDGYLFSDIFIDYNYLVNNKQTYTPYEKIRINKSKKNKFSLPIEFEYGYAITGHKAQGSQWDKVLVFEECFPFDAEEHSRWLYTAVTRASSRLILVR